MFTLKGIWKEIETGKLIEFNYYDLYIGISNRANIEEYIYFDAVLINDFKYDKMIINFVGAKNTGVIGCSKIFGAGTRFEFVDENTVIFGSKKYERSVDLAGILNLYAHNKDKFTQL